MLAMYKRIWYAFLLFALLPCGLRAANPWHQGQFVYKHNLGPIQRGEIPADLHITLDDGTVIDVAALASDDVFAKLVKNWSTERTDYRSTPPSVDQFLFRLKGVDKRSGLRIVEINFLPHPIYGRHWVGITRAIQ